MLSSEMFKVVLTSGIHNMLIYSLLLEVFEVELNFYIIKISSPTLTTYKRLYIATRYGILDMYREKET